MQRTATKARLMPGNPATEGVIEGRGGKFVVDEKKVQELEEKKKAIQEVIFSSPLQRSMSGLIS